MADLKEATRCYLEFEEHVKALNNALMPIDKFNLYHKKMVDQMQNIIDEAKGNLDNFMGQLQHQKRFLSESFNDSKQDIDDTLAKFNKAFRFIFAQHQLVRVSNFYKIEFYQFDTDYIPFNRMFGDV